MAVAYTEIRPLPMDGGLLPPPTPSSEISTSCGPCAALSRAESPRTQTALAFWRRSSRVLVAFNSAFAALLKMEPARLSSFGATWESFLTPSESTQLHLALDAGIKVTQSKKMQLRLISMDGSVCLCTVSITLILTNGDEEELLWAVVPDRSVACPSVAPPVFNTVYSRRHSHGSSFSGSEEEEADSAEAEPSGALRELVPTPTRGRNPWDANVIKFSLKRRSPPAESATARKRVPSPEMRPL